MGETRIQLCGPLVGRVDGVRVEDRLPGRQGRLLFAYLILERQRDATREELADVLWGELIPEASDAALSALLSKLRRSVPIVGRGAVRIVLPVDTWVDVEVAREALHRAESACARGDWAAAWGPARVAQHVAARRFLPAESGGWVEAVRREVDGMLVRSLELAGLASARIGGGELATAERAARRVCELAPLRESGTRLLMEVLALQGNRAEALLAYDALRLRLRADLGVGPSPDTQELHRRLLA